MTEIKTLQDIEDLASTLSMFPKNVFIGIVVDAETYRNLNSEVLDMVYTPKNVTRDFHGMGLTTKGINFIIFQKVPERLNL